MPAGFAALGLRPDATLTLTWSLVAPVQFLSIVAAVALLQVDELVVVVVRARRSRIDPTAGSPMAFVNAAVALAPASRIARFPALRERVERETFVSRVERAERAVERRRPAAGAAAAGRCRPCRRAPAAPPPVPAVEPAAGSAACAPPRPAVRRPQRRRVPPSRRVRRRPCHRRHHRSQSSKLSGNAANERHQHQPTRSQVLHEHHLQFVRPLRAEGPAAAH